MKLIVFLKPEKVTKILIEIVISLGVLSLLGQFSFYFLPDYPLKFYFIDLFNVNQEGNIPSLYSFLALLFCSILLFTIALGKKIERAPYLGHWIALSLIFLFLSLDENLQIHEQLAAPVKSLGNLPAIFHYAWVLPFSFLVGIFILSYIKFVRHLPEVIRNLFILAGSLYIGGALGMELVSGYYFFYHGQFNFMFQLLVTVEELMEMLGIIVFIHALLSYIQIYLALKEVSLEFRLA